jgi:hypothetical protein
VDITSEPAGAEILINGQKMGNTPMQVELEAGNFQLEVRKSMYASDISEFTLKESQTIPITRTLKPRFGYLSVNASIPNSKITLDGKMLPSSSIEKAQISSGAHTVKIEQALYHVFNETFSVADGEHKVIKAPLRPAFGSLAVRSEPESGTDVYLDGVNVGKTPYSAADLASGRYQLKVTKPLYGDAEEQIEITDEGKTERTIVLSKNFGELEITAPDAAIYVKEQLAGSGQVLLKLPPGRYKVKALRTEKYYPAEEDVILGIGDMKKITLTPEPKMGIVTVTTAPYEARDAEIFVDEKPNGNAPRSLELIIGTYTLTARKTGYLDVSQSIAIIENQKQRLDLQMMTYAGSQAEKANLWARYKWISWGVAALAGGATLYFHSAAESNYSNYSSAKTSADAQTYWDKTTLNNSLKNVSIGVAGATLVTGLISLIVQSGYGN